MYLSYRKYQSTMALSIVVFKQYFSVCQNVAVSPNGSWSQIINFKKSFVLLALDIAPGKLKHTEVKREEEKKNHRTEIERIEKVNKWSEVRRTLINDKANVYSTCNWCIIERNVEPKSNENDDREKWQ